MDAISGRSLLVVASLQAATSLAALLSSPIAAAAAAAIGVLAVGRYAAVAFFAATMGRGSRSGLHVAAASAWILGLFALLAAVAAVMVRARPALPWAIAAAFAGPVGMSILALGTGIGSLVSRHPAQGGGAAHSGGKK
jgi:hypothetical protein